MVPKFRKSNQEKHRQYAVPPLVHSTEHHELLLDNCDSYVHQQNTIVQLCHLDILLDDSECRNHRLNELISQMHTC